MKNILIVDDNGYFLAGLSMNLCRYLDNWNILTAESGSKALEIVETVAVDLIVADLEMPSMNGSELMESLRQKHPDLPFFIMISGVVPETERRLAAMGATRCLEKPFGFKELADMIIEEIGGRAPIAA
jgi:CheY-like chemotaxis protein